MSEASYVKVTEKGREVPTPVIVYVNKKVFEGWKDVTITRELNSVASDFQMAFTDKWKVNQDVWKLSPGDHVHIHARGKSLLTGYIDQMEASVSADDRNMKISGRSKTADLVDCSAAIASYDGLNLQEIAKKLCEPFHVGVVFLGPVGGPVKTKTITPGESVFTVLEFLARQKKFLMYPSVEGQLVFAPVGTKRATTEIRQGVNFQGGSVRHDNSNRFSQYEVKGQAGPNLGTEIQTIQPQGKAYDKGITRYRPMIINSENTMDDNTGGDRATYERDLRAGQALEVEVQVQGWFQPDGTLWDINQVVRVDAGYLGIRRDLIIKKVVYNKAGSGTTAALTLTRADAFEFLNKPKKKEENLGWVKSLETK